mgnify:CR=1 FL=1
MDYQLTKVRGGHPNKCHIHCGIVSNIHYNKYIKRRTPMKISSEQIKKDIEYLSTLLDNDEQINEVLQHCENFGVGSAQYFCEEFVFIPEGETPEMCERFHDNEYLDISEFNYHHWIGNDMEDYNG